MQEDRSPRCTQRIRSAGPRPLVRSLVQFAKGKYKEATAELYGVLAVGPGWEWTTLGSLHSSKRRRVDLPIKRLSRDFKLGYPRRKRPAGLRRFRSGAAFRTDPFRVSDPVVSDGRPDRLAESTLLNRKSRSESFGRRCWSVATTDMHLADLTSYAQAQQNLGDLYADPGAQGQ
jgi:hypothetical protein